MRKEEWQSAVRRAEKFITDKYAKPGVQVRIYWWMMDGTRRENSRLRSIGLRVAELSFWKPHPDSTERKPRGAGSSYMQVDLPWGACVCLLVERLILAYAEAWPKDEIEEEEARLLYAFNS